jgi:cytochrome c biogenesis protein CcdA
MALNFKLIWELFAAGFVFGIGPCFLFCAPLILPYIISKGLDKKGGFKATVFFSIGRIAAYSVLGFASVALLDTLTIRKNIFKQSLGALIIIIVLFDLLKGPVKFCGLLGKKYFEKTNLNSFAAGVLIGLSPCAPFLGVLTYIVAKSDSPLLGLVNGFSFGLGTFFSPLVLLGFFAGMIAPAFENSKKLFMITRIAADLIVIYFGVKLVL